MVNKIMKSVIGTIGGLIGVLLVYLLMEADVIRFASPTFVIAAYIGSVLLFGIIFFFLSQPIINFVKRIAKAIERELEALPVSQVISGGLGLIAGLFLASLISQPIGQVLEGVPVAGTILKLLLTAGIYIILGYLGISLATTKKDELQGAVQRLRIPTKERKAKVEHNPKILDTSVIIDGRIAEIIEVGFVEGEIVVPSFVLLELQHIADSQDNLRRQKGRRGLDIINQIKQNERVHVTITNVDFEEIPEVDSKLIQLAKDMQGQVVTTDYNLNKLANVHGIRVLNINELANAMKPIVIPGEEMTITVIKDGKEHNQGLAYLDDGTMIVVENGRKHIGTTIQVLVTSILQTSAGKMIFAKPK